VFIADIVSYFQDKEKINLRGQFVINPLRLLKHASNYISTHEKCDCHRLSVTQVAECVQRYSNTNSDINVLLNDIIVDQLNEKRIILASIIKCILFVSKQNIAFKGNDDNGLPNDENFNSGNFKSFILFRAEAGDEALQKHLIYCHNNTIYLNLRIQNELINSCACFIRNLLLNEIINQNTFYAVITDETSDVLGTTQLPISIRFVSDEKDI